MCNVFRLVLPVYHSNTSGPISQAALCLHWTNATVTTTIHITTSEHSNRLYLEWKMTSGLLRATVWFNSLLVSFLANTNWTLYKRNRPFSFLFFCCCLIVRPIAHYNQLFVAHVWVLKDFLFQICPFWIRHKLIQTGANSMSEHCVWTSVAVVMMMMMVVVNSEVSNWSCSQMCLSRFTIVPFTPNMHLIH